MGLSAKIRLSILGARIKSEGVKSICVVAFCWLAMQQQVFATDSLLLPVVIKGFQFPKRWQLTPYQNWQVVVFQNQQWQAVTFQLDEMDQQGHVITDATHATGVLHAQDELLLLWNELSDQTWPGFATLPNRDDWLELTIESSLLGRRYAYVFRQKSPKLAPLSLQDHVGFSFSLQQVSSNFLQVEYAKHDYTEVKAIRLAELKKSVPAAASSTAAFQSIEWGPNILQGVHANFTTGLMHKGLRMRLNDQQHIQARLQAVRDGPIRVALRLVLSIHYAGMTLYNSFLMIHHYPNAVNLPSRFVGSSIKALNRFSWLLKQPQIHLRLTLQDVLGAQVAIANAERLYLAKVDGQLSASEKLLSNSLGRWLSVKTDSWQALLNNTLPPTQGGLLQQYLQGMDANFGYDEAASTLTIAADVQGLPKNAVKLLALLAQLPVLSGDDLRSWLLHWIELGESGKLNRLNELHQQVWKAWLKTMADQGEPVGPDQIAQKLMLDFQLTGFVGYESSALQNLLTSVLRQSTDWQQLPLLPFLKAWLRQADVQGFDLRRVQYRPLDNTLWFFPTHRGSDFLMIDSKPLPSQRFANLVNAKWSVHFKN